MKQRWGLDRNVLRPTPGDPWGVEQHHWNTGAKETPSWVAPCYVYRSRKCSPGLKIPLAAARQEKGLCGIFRKFRDFAAVKSPRFLTKLCPRPWPRDFDKAKRSTIMKTWIIAYMYKYVVSIHTCCLWHWLKNIILLFFSSVHTQLSVYRAKRCDSISVI